MSFLLYFDLFGISKSWLIFGKEKYNTRFSGFLSIILILLLSFKFYNTIWKIFNKKSYTQKTTYLNDPDSSLKLNMTLALCATQNFVKHIEWNYDLETIFREENKSIVNDIKINTTCNRDNYSIFFDPTKIKEDFSKCLCFKIPDNVIMNSRNDLNRSMHSIIINRVNKKFKGLDLLIYFVDYFFDYSKDEPFEEVINVLSFYLSSSSHSFQEMFFNKIIYIDDSYDFDFFEIEGKEKEIYSFSQRLFSENSFNETVEIFFFRFSYNNLIILNEISLFNIDIIYGAFGGLFQLIFSIFGYIGFGYNNIFLNEEIIKYYNNDKENIQTRKKLINIHDNTFRSIEEKSINNVTIQKSRNIKINSNKNIKNKSINKKIFKIYDLSDFITFYRIYSDIDLIKNICLEDDNTMKLFEFVSMKNLIYNIDYNNLFISRMNNLKIEFKEKLNYYINNFK